MTQKLSENARLQLIVEAVRYCQKVSLLGMPKACYTKALREPIYFLWEGYGKSKNQAAKYCSEASLELSHGNYALVYDHAIPFKFIQETLLEMSNPDEGKVKHVQETNLVSCLITKQEDGLLTSMGLRSRMPNHDGGQHYLARYDAAGIKVVLNPGYVSNHV